MSEFSDIPQHLISYIRKRESYENDFLGYIAPRKENILGISEGIPIKEVKIHNNVGILKPGEAAVYGKFTLCSAVIASRGDILYVIHIYPKNPEQSITFIKQLEEQHIIGPETGNFTNILLIGRQASLHQEDYAQISDKPPQIITLDGENKQRFNLLVYNNPKSPGDTSSFDLWFDEN